VELLLHLMATMLQRLPALVLIKGAHTVERCIKSIQGGARHKKPNCMSAWQRQACLKACLYVCTHRSTCW